ncbi:MAG: hypothetical protein IPM42_12095 [Saprospiraceae bacterium]|nr:hypothetical protein [Saprospiraceae bacterium]
MKQGHIILAVLLLSMVFACSKSGKKALEKGRYFDAVKQSSERLRKNPDNNEAKDILRTAYRKASDDYLKNIERAKNSNQPFRYERVLESYSRLNEMYDMIESCGACRSSVTPGSYYAEAEEARDIASDERWKAAETSLSVKSIPAARDAYNSLLELQKYAPTYPNLVDKIEEALFASSTHVVVEQPALNSRLFQYSNDYFQGKIEEYLQTNRRLNKFIRFYNPTEAEAIRLKPDHIVRLEFVEFVVGQTLIQSDTKELISKDSVIIGTTKIGEGKETNVYGKVKSKFTQNRKTVKSNGVLLMEISEFKTGRILQRSEMPGEFIWVNQWGHFNGDERALNKEQLDMCKNREELPPPPQQLFIEFCKPIYNQFTGKIKSFYDKY